MPVQRSLLCGCGSSELFAAGRCAHCYWAWRHDLRKFKGQRRKTILRDGACLICVEIELRRLVCHHVDLGTTRDFATLCRRCHPKVHFKKRLPAFASPAFRRLWRKLHPDAIEQLELPFFAPDGPQVQAALFAVA